MPANLGSDLGAGLSTGTTIGTSILPGWGTAIGAAVGALAGIAAYLIQSYGDDQARQILQNAQDSAGQITLQSIQKSLGDTLGPTELAKIQQDPRFAAAQNDVLSEEKRISDSGGMTVEARGQYNDTLNRSASEQSRLRQAALQQMRMRGQNTSGAETQLLAAGAQGAANANAEAGVQALSAAQQRALQALQARGQLSGQMQAADWQRQSDVARSQDVINQLNWGNRQAAYANQANLANQQVGWAGQQAGIQMQGAQNGARFVENTGAALGQGAVGLYNGMRTPTDTQPPPTNRPPPAPDAQPFDSSGAAEWNQQAINAIPPPPQNPYDPNNKP